MNTWRNLPGKLKVSLLSLHPGLRREARRAAEDLGEGEKELFLSLGRYDLAHSLAMARRLGDDPLLRRAALLHDTGKLRRDLAIPTRWLYTFLEILFPRRLRRMCAALDEMARGREVLEMIDSLPRGWRRGFFVQAHHGEIAAAMLRRAGSDGELVRLVGEHQGEPRDARARRLREADDAL
jgi:putative nucleotidyltransferase with HDIG domain